MVARLAAAQRCPLLHAGHIGGTWVVVQQPDQEGASAREAARRKLGAVVQLGHGLQNLLARARVDTALGIHHPRNRLDGNARSLGDIHNGGCTAGSILARPRAARGCGINGGGFRHEQGSSSVVGGCLRRALHRWAWRQDACSREEDGWAEFCLRGVEPARLAKLGGRGSTPWRGAARTDPRRFSLCRRVSAHRPDRKPLDARSLRTSRIDRTPIGHQRRTCWRLQLSEQAMAAKHELTALSALSLWA